MKLPVGSWLSVIAAIALLGALVVERAHAGSGSFPSGVINEPGVRLVPDGNAANVVPNIPAANLWLCDAPTCTGPGEGSLRVVEQAFGVASGLGAYELAIEFDHTILGSINPCDVVFGIGGAGAGRGPVDEPDTSAGNPDCADDSGSSTLSTCSLSVPVEHLVMFGCVTAGGAPGPQGAFPLATLLLVPAANPSSEIAPSPGNGAFTVVANRTCELATVLGDPVPGSLQGGRTRYCRDLGVTVRALEADFDADCDVDTADAQGVTSRYGGLFGGALYDKRYDLEPTGRDLDIDIKDVQRVYARLGSTCQAPIPAQRPIGPLAPFRD